jgi:RNA polymerase sigma-70 factor (ECF subfamily)
MGHDFSKPGDTELINQVLQGDVNAFESLMNRYGEHVLKIVKSHVPYPSVGETTQDVFVRVFQSLSSYKGGGSFQSWLSTIAVRTCYDFWRKAYKNREIPMSALSDRHEEWLENVISDDSISSFEEKGAEREAAEILDWALARLSPEDRMVLELVYMEGRSGKEAARLLGWSLANVKVRSFRAKKKLRKIILDQMPEGDTP